MQDLYLFTYGKYERMIITLSSSRKLEQLTVWMTLWWLKKSIILAEFSLTTTKNKYQSLSWITNGRMKGKFHLKYLQSILKDICRRFHDV